MLVASLAALALAGCGGGGATTTAPPADSVMVHITNTAYWCADVRSGATAGQGAPAESVEWLIRMARLDPERVVDGRSMRQVLSDSAAALRPCAPALAARLDRAVGDLP